LTSGARQALALAGGLCAATVLLARQTWNRLSVAPGGACVLEEAPRFLGLIPVRIRWDGTARGRTITWTTSSIRVGWAGPAGWTVLAPPVAERIRAAPWRLISTAPEEAARVGGAAGAGPAESSRAILRAACLYREGAGYLMYRSRQ
jgi:hypothetical protein